MALNTLALALQILLTAALVGVTFYYALQNRRMAIAMRKQNELTVEPLLTLRLESVMLGQKTGEVESRPALEVENIGRGPALFVRPSPVTLPDPIDGLRFSVDFASIDVVRLGERKMLDIKAAIPLTPVDDQARAGFYYGNCLDPERAVDQYLIVLSYEDVHARALESRVHVGKGGVRLLSHSARAAGR